MIVFGEHVRLVAIHPARMALAAVSHFRINNRHDPIAGNALADRRTALIVRVFVDVLVDDASQQLPCVSAAIVGRPCSSAARGRWRPARRVPSRRAWRSAQSIVGFAAHIGTSPFPQPGRQRLRTTSRADQLGDRLAQQLIRVRDRGGAHHARRVHDRQHLLREHTRRDRPLNRASQHHTVSVVDQQPRTKHRQRGVMERNLVSFDPQRPLPIQILRSPPVASRSDTSSRIWHNTARINNDGGIDGRPLDQPRNTRRSPHRRRSRAPCAARRAIERVVVTLKQPSQQRIHPEEAPLAVSRAQHHDLAAIPSHRA